MPFQIVRGNANSAKCDVTITLDELNMGIADQQNALVDYYKTALRQAAMNHCENIAILLKNLDLLGMKQDAAVSLVVGVVREFLQEEESNVFLVVEESNKGKLTGSLFTRVEQYILAHSPHMASRPNMVSDASMPNMASDASMPNMASGASMTSMAKPQAAAKKRSVLNAAKDCVKGALTRNAKGKNASAEKTDSKGEMMDMEVDMMGSAPMEPVAMPSMMSFSAAAPQKVSSSLEDILGRTAETFQQRLFRYVDERGMKDSEVYKSANMSKQLFSKIRSDQDYQPKKKTVQALALALHLNIDEAKDLLRSAGYALSPANKVDLVFEYFIINGIYDIISLDMVLFEHDLPLIG